MIDNRFFLIWLILGSLTLFINQYTSIFWVSSAYFWSEYVENKKEVKKKK